jgi:hypothetical protein
MIGKEMEECTRDVDGNFTGNCIPKPILKDDVKRGDMQGPRAIDYRIGSQRMDKENYNRVANFVDDDDTIPLVLLYSLQKKRPYQSYQVYRLTRIILSDEAMVWMTPEGTSAIVCLVGQNIAKNSQHLIDDLNIAGATANEACQLRLARVGSEIISKLKEYGVPEIILCGYSLGGAAVACIAGEATRGIIFNGGAPPTSSPRPVPDNCKVYHIVGDILSTHYLEAKRIYLVETLQFREQTDQDLQTDGIQWYDVAYYHDMDRFMDHGGPFKIVSPQFEQNSLENYVYFKTGDVSDALAAVAGVISVNFNFRRKLQLLVCSNPIPGAYPSRGCREGGPTLGDKIAGAAIGGLLGGAAASLPTAGTGLVAGATAGAAAGAALASGEKGILDLINPDIGKTVVDVGEKLVAGASALDSFNTGKGVMSSQIQFDRPEQPKMDRLVQRVK